ncbi:MAG: phage major capsid protein [Candidatus Omnitrophota bacterium]
MTDEEKSFIREKSADLSAEDKEKFKSVLEEEKTMSEEEVKKLIGKAASDLLDQKIDKMSEALAAKFMDGVKEQRKKADMGSDNGKDEKKDDVTRKFMKALIARDFTAIKALTTTTPAGSSPDDANAGALIPTELLTEVLRIKETFGLARRDMRYLPFSGPGNERKIPALGTTVSVYWTNEAAAKKSTQPKFSLVTQTLKKLAAIVPFTEEILEDSAINLTQLVAELFAEAVAKEEDMQFFAGTGTPWTGILNNGNVNIVYQVTGGIANLSADDLLNMQDAIPAGALANAKYYMSPSVFNQIRKIKDLQDNYIFQAPQGTTPGTIWNKQYVLSDAFPAVGDVADGSPYILFGDLRMAAVFGDKQQLRVKLLEEATIHDTDWTDQSAGTSINLAEQDMMALRVVERVGYVLALPDAVAVLDSGESASS